MLKVTPYQTEPYLDFNLPENIQAYKNALADVGQDVMGKTYPLIIDGEKIYTTDTIASLNPCQHSEILGYTAKATLEHAEMALQGAWKAFETWKTWRMEARARILIKAAKLLRDRRMEFNAILTLEAGKNYAEAEAEIAECIDFLDYYAREAMKYAGAGQTYSYAGEENQLLYIPLGVGVSISPWNFPLAIFAGMLAAPIVVGNCVIAKPAEDTGIVAAKLVDLLYDAGLPKGVVQFLPGVGEEVGDYLVKHSQTRFITFTGSRGVGLHIYAEAAKVQQGQKWLKRSILELGGKDALIVDSSADIEVAATAAVQSAFGFNGQKCSAMSRLILVEDVYDAVLERVLDKISSLSQGIAEDNPNITAVVNEESFDKIVNYLEVGRNEGRVLCGGHADKSSGYFVAPTLIAVDSENARIAQEEIFGPVVAVLKATDFDHALAIANSSEYGLTGGVISNSREHLEQAREQFEVGNLYFNRKITGALVGIQPFGGYNMSGTDSKAGGPDYLTNFLQLKTITERF